jgi:hypothetical protein
MSESLAWEKWSSFSHNRYVEEAERYSKPGSVAQKKAFFEAHYKKLAAQKAAALLEQQNNAAAQNNVNGKQDNSENNDSQKSSKYEVVVKEEQDDAKVLSHDLDSYMEQCIVSESNNVGLRNSVMVELQKRLENVDTLQEQSEKFCATPPVMTPILEKTVVLRNSLRDELRKEVENVDTLQEQSEKLSPTPPTMTPILKVIMFFYFEECFWIKCSFGLQFCFISFIVPSFLNLRFWCSKCVPYS